MIYRSWKIAIILLIGLLLLSPATPSRSSTDMIGADGLYLIGMPFLANPSSTIWCQNIDTVDVTLTVHFYTSGGSEITPSLNNPATLSPYEIIALPLSSYSLAELPQGIYSAVIDSDAPIPCYALQEPTATLQEQFGGYPAAYGGSDNLFYSPVYKGVDGVSSVLWVQNFGYMSANLSATLYDSSGVEITTLNKTDLPVYTSWQIDLAYEWSVPNGFVGSVVFSADQPINLAVLQPIAEDFTYDIGQPASEMTAVLPRLFKSYDDGAGPLSSSITITNMGTTDTNVQLTITDGLNIYPLNYSLGVGEVKTVDMAAQTILPDGKVYAGRISSYSAPIMVTELARHDLPGGLHTSYLDTDLTQATKVLERLVNAPDRYSVITLFNTGSSTASLTLRFRDMSGSQVLSLPLSLAGYGLSRINLQDVSGLPSGFEGSATLEAADAGENITVMTDEYIGGGSVLFDLPFSFDKEPSLALYNWDLDDGKIVTWFDHDYPAEAVSLGNGVLMPYFGDPKTEDAHVLNGTVTCYEYPEYCYDNHNGYDFGLEVGSPILAAAAGKVQEAGCGFYGYYVVLKHTGNYFTLYGHFANPPLVSAGEIVAKGQQLGVMGGTGGLYDSLQGKYVCEKIWADHLHFGVYRDENSNGNWDSNEVLDPSGWFGDGEDPTVSQGYLANAWLWAFERVELIKCETGGCIISDIGDEIVIIVPPDFFGEEVELELIRQPASENPDELLFSTGDSFILELTEPDALILAGEPLSMTVEYTDESILHLDEEMLTVYQLNPTETVWEQLNTFVDEENNLLVAETYELGEFDVQAPLLCPADSFIFDDSYYGATMLTEEAFEATRLFDIQQDEDWFRFYAQAGNRYRLQTAQLAAEVDTQVALIDTDGYTILDQDDDSGGGTASQLDWIAPADGVYFIQVVRDPASIAGCTASYELNLIMSQDTTTTFLPLVVR